MTKINVLAVDGQFDNLYISGSGNALNAEK